MMKPTWLVWTDQESPVRQLCFGIFFVRFFWTPPPSLFFFSPSPVFVSFDLITFPQTVEAMFDLEVTTGA